MRKCKKHRKNCECCPGHSLTISQPSKSLSLQSLCLLVSTNVYQCLLVSTSVYKCLLVSTSVHQCPLVSASVYQRLLVSEIKTSLTHLITESVTRSPIELFWTAKNISHHGSFLLQSYKWYGYGIGLGWVGISVRGYSMSIALRC